MTQFDQLTKISAYPITIRSIDAVNKISTQYYDHGRAALTEAILANRKFCFNPWARNLRPMITFYLGHRHSLGEADLPTVEEVIESCQNLINFIKASRKEIQNVNS